MEFTHISVLREECIAGLNIQEDGIYLDGTFGRGGHSRALLQRLGPTGRLIALDRDESAVQAGEILQQEDRRFSIFHRNFSALGEVCAELDLTGRVNGIMLDLGISSPQIDDAERGFSFDKDGPLDMRMDRSAALDAAVIVNEWPESELAAIFKNYGEERYARRAAHAVVLHRAQGRIERTLQLADILKAAIPGAPGPKHKATRCFQALRIAVNAELDELEAALKAALAVLAPGGRLCVISFHSLEDRIVKQFFRQYSTLPDFVKNLPLTQDELYARYGSGVQLKVIGSACRPGEAEIARNVRSRSAVLRIAERLGGEHGPC